jgi:adenylate cyclase
LVSDAVYAQIKGKVGARFTSAGELTLKNIAEPVRAWRWVGEGMQARALTRASASDPELPSIAILPFANLSGDPEQDFFADGLVEDIITILSKLSGLLVIARHTSFVYKNRSVDVSHGGCRAWRALLARWQRSPDRQPDPDRGAAD